MRSLVAIGDREKTTVSNRPRPRKWGFGMSSQSFADNVFGRRSTVPVANSAGPPKGVAPVADGGSGESAAGSSILKPASEVKARFKPDPLAVRAIAWIQWASSALVDRRFYGSIVDDDGDVHPLRATVVNIIADMASSPASPGSPSPLPPAALIDFAESFHALVASGGDWWCAHPDQNAAFPDPSLDAADYIAGLNGATRGHGRGQVADAESGAEPETSNPASGNGGNAKRRPAQPQSSKESASGLFA